MQGKKISRFSCQDIKNDMKYTKNWFRKTIWVLRLRKIQTSISGITRPVDLKFGIEIKPERPFFWHNFRRN